MFISACNVETILGEELATRLCDWLCVNAPVCCKKDFGYGQGFAFDIDDALEFCKIRMLQDSGKKEFFPHLVRLKNCQVSGAFEHARPA